MRRHDAVRVRARRRVGLRVRPGTRRSRGRRACRPRWRDSRSGPSRARRPRRRRSRPPACSTARSPRCRSLATLSPWSIWASAVSGWFCAPAARGPSAPPARTAPASAPRTCCRPRDGVTRVPRVRVGRPRRRLVAVGCGSRRPAGPGRSCTGRCPGTCASAPKYGPRRDLALRDPDVARRSGSPRPGCRNSTGAVAGARGVSGSRIRLTSGSVVEAEVHGVVERRVHAWSSSGTWLRWTIRRPVTASQPLSTEDSDRLRAARRSAATSRAWRPSGGRTS